tara:strand:- start:77 stop:517 length:441 start_codon:yes stop_codon:yes gene_type:complete
VLELVKYISLNYIFYTLAIILFLYLGWKIRKIYKNFIFYLNKRKGIRAEKIAIKILKNNGYKIIKQQPRIKGSLYENDKKILFFVRADLLVSKENTIYVAEVKSGKAASINEIATRRQLLEYSKIFNSNIIILIDTKQNKIKKIQF